MPKYLVCRYFAGNFAEVVEAFADVLGEEIAGEAGIEAVQNTHNSLVGTF
jgi:hypothetical protein